MIPQQACEYIDRFMPLVMEQLFNSGGPSSRSRRQIINQSMLGAGKGHIFLNGVTTAALDFGEIEPFTAVQSLFDSFGIDDPEQLRSRYQLPGEPCICRESNQIKALKVATADPDKVLYQVAILALSTPFHFDPRRPVLLTRAALTRRLELFSGRGFYV